MKLNLGLVPVHDDPESEEALEQVDQALAIAMGQPVDLHLAGDPASMARAFADGVLNVAWASPTLVCGHEAFQDARPLLSSLREGAPYYHGVLFVRRDAPHRSMLDLRDCRVAWVAKSSASGYIYPRVALAEMGVDVTGYFSDERFLGTHGEVVHAVVRDEVDLGATFAVFKGGNPTQAMLRSPFIDLGLADRVRVVLSTPPIPADLFVGSAALSEGEAATVATVLRHATQVAPAAFSRIFGTSELVPTNPENLEELRRSMSMARELGVID